jgi:predicted DNA-binding protein
MAVIQFGGPAVPRTISMPAELSDALTERARQEDRTMSKVVQRALIAYLEEAEGDAEVGDDEED